MTPDAQPQSARGRLGSTALTFAALAALTVAEIKLSALHVAGPGPATALSALLIGKVGIVMAYCLRANFRRRSAPRLVAIALAAAAAFAVVLMLEAAFQARVS